MLWEQSGENTVGTSKNICSQKQKILSLNKYAMNVIKSDLFGNCGTLCKIVEMFYATFVNMKMRKMMTELTEESDHSKGPGRWSDRQRENEGQAEQFS